MSEPPDPSPAAAEIVSGIAGFTQRAADVVRAARLDLCIFSHELDRRVYASPEMVGAVRAFALQHRRARVRVIVHSPTMRGGNRLVELGRVLSSRMQFRQLQEERRSALEEYLIADEASLIHKESYDQLEARYFAHDPLEARRQLRIFNVLWEECVPAREYTVLGI